MIIAIQTDDFPWPRGAHPDASAPRWAKEIEAAGHQVRWVDVYRPDILKQLRGCHGFLWRHAHVTEMRHIAHRLLPVIEQEMGLVVYPDQRTSWHYDDKIVQAYLFDAHKIPAPKTWVWYDREGALQWCAEEAEFPIVVKLWAGAGSVNVRLVQTVDEAQQHVRQMFDHGMYASASSKSTRDRIKDLLRNSWARLRPGTVMNLPDPYWDVHYRYALFQEWLPGNDFDTRVTVIGNRAFGFRRFNRQGDFRASGSGHLDWDPKQVDPAFIRLAFAIAERLGTQSCAMDGLYRDGEAVACEISYTYSSSAVRECPGHWRLIRTEHGTDQLEWREGQLHPESAQIHDFLQRLETTS